ncbi:plasmid pRiA4b ORF-3 family protein [Aurantimonas sp. VKM B-3413]|uniref:plasmid pRiA4b ORF-3 family protein n=1 Tax=Aurantimonas sp. VKM B-3413 TaxID=2779401 RepID=UPI001E456654|nr:plasmid pRiA4b ORF-3 family protein [Aurantimonas sp. VKM B-3413]MCB8835859.1 plasmid pRiA4b ORF-3 family protein [Aurantimonas sp. VKM B-3413]
MPDVTTDPLDGNSCSILQLKVRLIDISPMTWRRLLVPTTMTLHDLHGVFQVAIGWRSLHLFQFRIHAVHYGSWDLGAEMPDRTLGSFNLRDGDKFVYEYDMTDFWEHEVRVEAWIRPQPRKRYPVCIGGKGACPPEDCGGPRGYDERRAQALGLEAFEDMDTIADLLDQIVLQSQPHLLADEAIRWQLEDTLERNRAREPFWKDRFSRRAVNARLHAGDHHVFKHQHLC